MSRHFLCYWRLRQVQYKLAMSDLKLDHAAGEQLGKVRIGDVLWIVTTQGGHLFLVGRLQVGKVVDEETAKRELGDCDLYEATWHVIAQPGTTELLRSLGEETNLVAIASHLRFLSKTGHDRLMIKNDGTIDPMQLRALRLLSEESAQLLNAWWYARSFIPQNALDFIESIEDTESFLEGRIVSRTYQGRQRSREAIERKKKQFLQEHGRLFCEVCGFDFGECYGDFGQGYIEAHHKHPLSASMEEHSTQLDDLILLCANCHRIIHRRRPPLSVEELRDLITRKQ